MVFVASLSCSSIYVPGRGPSRPPHSGSPSAAREYRSMADAVSRYSCRRPAGKCSRCAAGPPSHQHCPQPLPPAFQKRPAGTGRSLPCSGADAADGGPPRTTGATSAEVLAIATSQMTHFIRKRPLPQGTATPAVDIVTDTGRIASTYAAKCTYTSAKCKICGDNSLFL